MAEDPRDAAAVDELDELLLEAKLSNDKIKSLEQQPLTGGGARHSMCAHPTVTRTR